MALELLWGHIGQCTSRLLERLRTRTVGHKGQAKIREPDLLVRSQQQILRLEVAVNQSLRMDVLQGGGYLLDIGNDGVQGQPCPLGVELSEGATWGIVHHQKRDVL